MLKNVVFDFGNVIVKFNPDEILYHYNLTPKEHDILLKTIFASKEWLEIDAGTLTEKQATDIFISKVPSDLQDKVRQIMKTWPENTEFIRPILHLIKELKEKGYKVFGLSNTGMYFANFIKNSELGTYFDGYVLSAQEKLVKPDAAIYQKLFSQYNLKPDECLFIDDLPKNIEGAEKVGMHGFVFNGKNIKELRKKIETLSK